MSLRNVGYVHIPNMLVRLRRMVVSEQHGIFDALVQNLLSEIVPGVNNTQYTPNIPVAHLSPIIRGMCRIPLRQDMSGIYNLCVLDNTLSALIDRFENHYTVTPKFIVDLDEEALYRMTMSVFDVLGDVSYVYKYMPIDGYNSIRIARGLRPNYALDFIFNKDFSVRKLSLSSMLNNVCDHIGDTVMLLKNQYKRSGTSARLDGYRWPTGTKTG